MKSIFWTALAAVTLAMPAAAHDYRLGDLQIHHPAIPAPLTRAMSAAGYLTIRNDGAEADRLLAVEAGIARRVEVHTTEHGSDGSAKMVHVETLEIPAGAELALAPGGYHVMFMGLTSALSEGSRIPGALVFEKAGRVEVEFAVEAPRKPGAGDVDHSAHGDHAQHGAEAKDADAKDTGSKDSGSMDKAKHSH